MRRPVFPIERELLHDMQRIGKRRDPQNEGVAHGRENACAIQAKQARETRLAPRSIFLIS
jgi:hypothetical protein